MAYLVADRVKETTTSTGTGTITLAGAATGFRTFLSAIGNSNTTTYVIVDATGAQWEVGLGTLSGGTTLTRTKVYFSSSGVATAVNFSAGTKSVFVSMSADPFGSNVSLGTYQGFQPNLYQYNTVIGYGASVSSDYATAVGQYATASGGNAVALGGGTTASASGATALGQQSTASGSDSTAVGKYAVAGGSSSLAAGINAGAGLTGAVALGSGSLANGTDSVALGSNVSTPNTNQFGVKMRTDPGGVSGISVLWDSATNEVYATTSGGGGGVTSIIAGTGISITSTGPGGTGAVTINATGGGGGPNWATYQDNDMSSIALSLATPSATTSTMTSTWFFSPSASPSGSWGFMGSSGGGVGATYSNSSYPITTPITGPTFSGPAVCYFPSYQSDPGTISTFQVTSGSSPYSNFSSSITIGGGWPVFGSTRYGHCIAIISGSFVSSFTASSGCTVAASFYDSFNNYTYLFINADSAAVANISAGMSFGTLGGSSASYQLFFWYNY